MVYGKVPALSSSHIYRKIPSTVVKVNIHFCVPGCMPNITRNAIVNCAELVTYDMIKELILKYDLMTGGGLNQASYRYQSNKCRSNRAKDVTLLLSSHRQHAVPLHSCLQCRLLHNGGGFARGRD